MAFLNPGGHLPTRTKYVPKIDSVEYAIHDTITVDSLIEVEVEVEVPVEVPVEKRIEVPVIQPVDTAEIIKSHFAKVQYKDVLKLPNNQGTVTITDTIANNTIVPAGVISKIYEISIPTTTENTEKLIEEFFKSMKNK